MRNVTVTETAKSDLTGKEASEVRSFVLDGTEYVIDLTDKEAGVFDRTMAKYTSKAHEIRTNPDQLRAWARDNGFAVGERGRISAEIRAAYEAQVFGTEQNADADEVVNA